ncbi:Short-chain dehydrogenase/reductase family protein [Mycena venus]|uniref:Short-chain dehydrogenase/reductase family protein n=1 Tax=Mycena venus TaxID=2733690 RepID=A0A8H6Y5T3_9AGAR|nr:Short-chain dehydrogenase/reductase family protein [Mycena venus]
MIPRFAPVDQSWDNQPVHRLARHHTKMPTVLVTGASKGIGLAVTSILLNKFKANVVALSRTRTPELLALASDSLLLVDGDITDESVVASAVNQGLTTFGGIDGLILNAATLPPLCRIGDETPLEQWKSHFDINFFSLVTALKLALPALRKSQLGGRVVFVSSGAAVKGTAGWGPYNASKAAMNSLCRTLAEEEPDVVSVALRPGMVHTDMQATLRQSGAPHMKAEDHQMFVAVHTNGKLLKAEDPGHVIASLALHAAKNLSGQFVSWDSQECEDYRSVA